MLSANAHAEILACVLLKKHDVLISFSPLSPLNLTFRFQWVESD